MESAVGTGSDMPQTGEVAGDVLVNGTGPQPSGTVPQIGQGAGSHVTFITVLQTMIQMIQDYWTWCHTLC